MKEKEENSSEGSEQPKIETPDAIGGRYGRSIKKYPKEEANASKPTISDWSLGYQAGKISAIQELADLRAERDKLKKGVSKNCVSIDVWEKLKAERDTWQKKCNSENVLNVKLETAYRELAAKFKELEAERDNLQEWKRQQLEVSKRWDAVYDYVQGHKDANVGDRITDQTLQFLKERDKLKEFKEYVHKRLDDAGIPVDPESEHKAKGCRIGGRLDVTFNRMVKLEAENERLKEERTIWDKVDFTSELQRRWPSDAEVSEKKIIIATEVLGQLPYNEDDTIMFGFQKAINWLKSYLENK